MTSCRKTNCRPKTTNNAAPMACQPYRDLFIYYLQGRVKFDGAFMRANFIGNWEEEDFSFLFFSSPAATQVDGLLQSQPELTYIDSYQMSYEQWHGARLEAYDHGQFRIIPCWLNNRGLTDVPDGKFPIILDPGVVFGTGTHPTTHDCLDALELAYSRTTPHTVLDLGTGTGVLALAAACLGAKRILAVDYNMLAAQTAERNVRLNNRKDNVVVVRGRAEALIHCPADLIIANIHFEVMQQLLACGAFLMQKAFILSGLLRREAKEVANILARMPVKVMKTWTHEGIWHTFYGKRS